MPSDHDEKPEQKGFRRANRAIWQRRAVLAGGTLALVAWVKGAPHLLSLRRPNLQFEALPGLKPFRRLLGAGPATRSGSIFAGLETADLSAADNADLLRSVRANPCTAIFGPMRPGPVPVAVFSDFACPVCRMMEGRLADLAARDPGSFRIVRHELPILGAASTTASRAVLAADRQGAYAEMHARLTRTPAVTDETYLAAIAADIGLNPDRLLADMASAGIDRQLRLTRAVADVFGFFGTPAFAVGQTVFMGALPTASLRALISEEVGNPCQRP